MSARSVIFSDLLKFTVLSRLLEVVFKFIVLVEMVLKGSLVPSGDYDDVFHYMSDTLQSIFFLFKLFLTLLW